MASSKRDRRAWSLLVWAQRRKQSHKIRARAQVALDAPTVQTGADTPAHGSLYRCGVTLAELQPGECGTVRILIGTTQARLRLLEMGLTPGTHVRVVHAAAFGGPLDILIRGYQLSLRREEAAAVWLGEEGDEGLPDLPSA